MASDFLETVRKGVRILKKEGTMLEIKKMALKPV